MYYLARNGNNSPEHACSSVHEPVPVLVVGSSYKKEVYIHTTLVETISQCTTRCTVVTVVHRWRI